MPTEMVDRSHETPAEPVPGAAPARAQLVIRNGGFVGMTYDLVGDETLIGRNPTTDITLLDEGISREHTLIGWDSATGTHTIEDLQSTNGTRVNGKRIRSATLQDGDEIQIGHTLFQFRALD
jgi:pSer/pThr/pTyr-binding forkhead associated (FHA) protein